jgi:hypothetical protein
LGRVFDWAVTVEQSSKNIISLQCCFRMVLQHFTFRMIWMHWYLFEIEILLLGMVDE